jgi:hypothetical protein
MKIYKPDNYNSLSPYLIVDNAQKLVDLLTVIFNAKTMRPYDNESKTVFFKYSDFEIGDKYLDGHSEIFLLPDHFKPTLNVIYLELRSTFY